MSQTLTTPRLTLRPWREDDLAPFATLTADPRVMEYFPAPLTREESDQLALKLKAHLEEKGWGIWAATVTDTGEFIGFIGIKEVTKEHLPAPFTPAVEVAWRLAHPHWGHGYATEGARAALHYGFTTLHLPEIVAYTAEINLRSRRVMEKLGMHRDPKDDFDHPKLPEGHRLRAHVLYRLTQQEYEIQS